MPAEMARQHAGMQIVAATGAEPHSDVNRFTAKEISRGLLCDGVRGQQQRDQENGAHR
jgi:hypothetical protein